jgi:hypothetical protein
MATWSMSHLNNHATGSADVDWYVHPMLGWLLAMDMDDYYV